MAASGLRRPRPSNGEKKTPVASPAPAEKPEIPYRPCRWWHWAAGLLWLSFRPVVQNNSSPFCWSSEKLSWGFRAAEGWESEEQI